MSCKPQEQKNLNFRKMKLGTSRLDEGRSFNWVIAGRKQVESRKAIVDSRMEWKWDERYEQSPMLAPVVSFHLMLLPNTYALFESHQDRNWLWAADENTVSFQHNIFIWATRWKIVRVPELCAARRTNENRELAFEYAQFLHYSWFSGCHYAEDIRIRLSVVW